MQKTTKAFANQREKICKRLLQKSTSNSLKENSESVSVNL